MEAVQLPDENRGPIGPMCLASSTLPCAHLEGGRKRWLSAVAARPAAPRPGVRSQTLLSPAGSAAAVGSAQCWRHAQTHRET
ncbi:unnamed protein product [Boreogadus saida]